ncbi:MAG: dephospho-CoA kinase [Pseudohongiellaceae bacterium]
MTTIGLTGGIGSGKSTVSDLFANLGVEIIDADVISRQVVEPGQPALASIADRFGDQILDANSRLRRRALREVVFHDQEARRWLEDLLHPLIGDAIRNRINQCKKPYCLLVSPLLLESSQRQLVDRIVVVDLPEHLQLSRTAQRDESSDDTVRAIMAAQLDRESRLAQADDVIHNEGTVEQLAAQVRSLHDKFSELADSRDANSGKKS